MVERRLHMTKQSGQQYDGHECVVSKESLSGVNSKRHKTISLIQRQTKYQKLSKLKVSK